MDGGLNTIEFYSGDISGNFATSAAPQANGGAQDNGSMSVTFSGSPTGPVQWQMGKGGDGFYGRIDPVGTGSSLRFWQGNNSGHLNRCTSNCTASGAGWSDRTGGWTGDIQSFILPYEIFKGDPNTPGNDCGARRRHHRLRPPGRRHRQGLGDDHGRRHNPDLVREQPGEPDQANTGQPLLH